MRIMRIATTTTTRKAKSRNEDGFGVQFPLAGQPALGPGWTLSSCVPELPGNRRQTTTKRRRGKSCQLVFFFRFPRRGVPYADVDLCGASSGRCDQRY